MRRIFCKTWKHLGDTLVLGAALRNLQLSHGGAFEVWHASAYSEVFAGWSYVHIGHPDDALELTVGYGGDKRAPVTASRGSITEAYTRTLGELLDVEIPYLTAVPPIYLTDEERAKYRDLAGAVILNSNCQECSMTKRYPYWQRVADLLAPERVVLIGGREARDVRADVKGENVIDLRGKTSLRELAALCSICAGVISPPSGIVHLAACFRKPTVFITGAREPVAMIQYPCAVAIASSCQDRRYHEGRGCFHLFSCEGQISLGGELYPRCMAEISPEAIADMARRRIFRGGLDGN